MLIKVQCKTKKQKNKQNQKQKKKHFRGFFKLAKKNILCKCDATNSNTWTQEERA